MPTHRRNHIKTLEEQMAFVRKQIDFYTLIRPEVMEGKSRAMLEENMIQFEAIEGSLMRLQELTQGTQ